MDNDPIDILIEAIFLIGSAIALAIILIALFAS